MWITWNINSDTRFPSTVEEKVEIFYQRAFGWQLHIADLLANGGSPSGKSYRVEPLVHSGFAVLQICLSYFETIGHYERNNGVVPRGSQYFFKEGVRSVLPQLLTDYGETVFDQLVARLYGGARCGLYHNSMTVPNVGLGQPPNDAPIAYDSRDKTLAISPERLTRALKAHLEGFRARLLDPNEIELRCDFEHRFNEDNGIT
jgi:hypothetical protein